MIKALQCFEASLFTSRHGLTSVKGLNCDLCDLEASLFRLDLFRAEICTSGLLSWLIVRPQYVDCVWNVMAHAQKPDFVFSQNGRVHLNPRGRHFSRLLAVEVCASGLVMLDTPRSEVLATHSIRQFPLHFPSHASPCAIRFETPSTTHGMCNLKACEINKAWCRSTLFLAS
jgi:hypothetical protein